MTTQQVMPIPSIPDETLGDRMRRALRKEHMSVQEMADYLGVSRNTVGTWINDHIRPSEQTFKLWAMRTGVPLEWLKDGQAPFQGGVDPMVDTHEYALSACATSLRAVA